MGKEANQLTIPELYMEVERLKNEIKMEHIHAKNGSITCDAHTHIEHVNSLQRKLTSIEEEIEEKKITWFLDTLQKHELKTLEQHIQVAKNLRQFQLEYKVTNYRFARCMPAKYSAGDIEMMRKGAFTFDLKTIGAINAAKGRILAELRYNDLEVTGFDDQDIEDRKEEYREEREKGYLQ